MSSASTRAWVSRRRTPHESRGLEVFLGYVREQFDWTLTADTGRHSERRATPRFHVEAVPKTQPGRTLDPIRALAHARTGNVTDTWDEAAEILSISLPDANALAAAASDRTWASFGEGRVPSPHRQQIRQQLLEAVGLMATPVAQEEGVAP